MPRRTLPMSDGLRRFYDRQSRALSASLQPAPTPESPPLTPEQHRAIYQNLRGAVCVCSAHKTARQSFCRSHYFALPVGLRRQLYEVDRYPETFARACAHLNLSLPAITQPEETK